VTGATEAQLMTYVEGVGEQVTLPYLSSAVEMKQSLDIWNAAVADHERKQEEERQRQAQIAAAAATATAVAGSAFAAAPASSASAYAWQSPPIAPGTVLTSSITFYDCYEGGFCGNMASGVQVFHGAAACSGNLPFGTRFRIANDPAGRVFTCLDRGALSSNHVDIWFYYPSDGWAFQSIVGTRGNIIIVG
jgi:hypothetical protein